MDVLCVRPITLKKQSRECHRTLVLTVVRSGDSLLFGRRIRFSFCFPTEVYSVVENRRFTSVNERLSKFLKRTSRRRLSWFRIRCSRRLNEFALAQHGILSNPTTLLRVERLFSGYNHDFWHFSACREVKSRPMAGRRRIYFSEDRNRKHTNPKGGRG